MIELTEPQSAVLATIHRFGHDSYFDADPQIKYLKVHHRPISPCPDFCVLGALYPAYFPVTIDIAVRDLETKGLLTVKKGLPFGPFEFIRDDGMTALVKFRKFPDEKSGKPCYYLGVEVNGQSAGGENGYYEAQNPRVPFYELTDKGLHLAERIRAVPRADVVDPISKVSAPNRQKTAAEACKELGKDWATIKELHKLTKIPESTIRGKIRDAFNGNLPPDVLCPQALNERPIPEAGPHMPRLEYRIKGVWPLLFANVG